MAQKKRKAIAIARRQWRHIAHCTLLHIVAEENHTPALIGSTKYTMVVHIGEHLT